MQSAAGDDKGGAKITLRRFDDPFTAIPGDPGYPRVELDLAARLSDEFAQFFANGGIINDAFLGHMDGSEPGGVRFDLFDLLRIQFAQTLQAIRVTALPKIFKPGQFGFFRRNHDLAALLVGDAMLTAERDHLLQAADAELRFFGTRFVVQSRMQHAAVVAGLVRREFGFLFQQQHLRSRPGFDEPIRRREPDDAAADDDGVVRHFFLPPLRNPTTMALPSLATMPRKRKRRRAP